MIDLITGAMVERSAMFTRSMMVTQALLLSREILWVAGFFDGTFEGRERIVPKAIKPTAKGAKAVGIDLVTIYLPNVKAQGAKLLRDKNNASAAMNDLLDLDRYPLDRPESSDYQTLVLVCREQMQANGMFNLEGFVRPAAVAQAAREVRPLFETSSFTHKRRHNVYFTDGVAGLAADHAALAKVETVNHTLCGDQLTSTIVQRIYEFTPLPAFLAAVLQKPHLYLMSDPLARFNVMDYRPGETLNWHFDRSLFTTTLLIQAAESGGEFEYRSALRSDSDPNYEGVARVLRGEDSGVSVNPLEAGTLNVFAGKNTLHRVSKIGGHRDRIVAVYSYYEQPGVMFSNAERVGFYGRAD